LRDRDKEAKQAVAAPNHAAAENEEEFEIVRTKHFSLKPMNSEEAILQMNLLGHNFFIFTNAETNRTNIVYRRKDGKYGLIEAN
jgi:putative sigma-54 modulation protein